MATYTELRSLYADDDLRNKVEVAVVKAAANLLGGTPTADEQKWAAAVFASPRGVGTQALLYVLAENSGLTVAAIQGATDAAIQTNVDAVAPALVVAHNAA
jgi:hypothetical protein